MSKGRLEAFSDGVMAILITIMILDLKVPAGTTWADLHDLLLHELPPYAMSFCFLGIYWNNHHHMLHMTDRINGRILWANLHLLFWLSLLPFVTAWLADAPVPAATYGVVALLSGVSYVILQQSIIAEQGPGSKLGAAVGDDIKGKASAGLYAAAIPLAFVRPWIAYAIYVFVSLMWFTPDRRIESKLSDHP